MSVQASSSRPAAKSIGAGFVDLILTLVIFLVAMLAFLLAPLLALGVAFLGYAVMRTRGKKPSSSTTAAQSDQASYGFGAGAP